jgi:O-antigen ligase
MSLAYYLVGAIVAGFIFWRPYIGIALIFAFVALQGVAGDALENSELFFDFFGAVTALSFLVRVLNGEHSISISATSLLILLFGVFILITNPDAALNRPDRNWFLTYFQLFLIVLLIDNVVVSEKALKQVMLIFLLTSLLFLWSIISMLIDADGEEGIEGANIYARTFLIASLFTYYHYRNAGRNKNWFLFLLVLQFLGTVLTQSRTGIILMVLGTLYVLYKDYRLNFASLIFVFALGALIYFIVPEDLTQSIQTDFVGRENFRNPRKIDYSSVDTNIRYYLWQIGYELWINSNIFFGIGIGQFKEEVKHYLPLIQSGIGLHNTYLSVLFETGIFGFLIFIAFVYRSLNAYIKAARLEEKTGLATVWLMCFGVMLIGGMTKHDHYDKLLFIIIGIATFFSRHAPRNAKT